MKKLALTLLFATALPVFADSAAESELLSAQTAYREALSASNKSDSHIAALQLSLNQAEARLTAAQAETEKLRTELQQAISNQTQYSQSLQTAGERLDKAWQAVRGK